MRCVTPFHSFVKFLSLRFGLIPITMLLPAQNYKKTEQRCIQPSCRRVQKQNCNSRTFENNVCLGSRGLCHRPMPYFLKNVFILSTLRVVICSLVFLIHLMNFSSLLRLLHTMCLRFLNKLQDEFFTSKQKKVSVDKKNQLDVTFCILYFSSNSCSTCFGQPCAHRQELTTA